MAYQIFVSYRRDGGEALACLISERLKNHGFKTFYDVESLRSGKFNEAIFSVINECDDVVVVLPPNGLDRCTNTDDWVRKEIAYALSKNKNIVPVMMRNFEFPEVLPEDIDEIRNFQGISANMEYFDAAFEKLLSLLNSNTFSYFENLIESVANEELKEKLIKCVEDLSKNNHAEAKFNMAVTLKKLNIKSLNENIAILYAQSADMGYAPAQNNLGCCYEYGIGVEKNISKAFNYYKMSADQGDRTAQCNVARCFENNHEQLYFEYMEKSAMQNHKSAILALGECYATGYGVAINYEKALKFYNKAAEMNCETAFMKLGEFYEYGCFNECYEYSYSLEMDWSKAKEFYQKAVEHGCAEAIEKTTDKYWKKKRFKKLFLPFKKIASFIFNW